MEKESDQFQRRALVGNQAFILADPAKPDDWAVPGSVVVAVDKQKGIRIFAPAKTVHTRQLQAYAQRKRLLFEIIEKYPVYRASGEWEAKW